MHENLFLKPSEGIYSTKPMRLSTVLGSCVAITLYDPVLQSGGMFHAMLPTCIEMVKCSIKCSNAYRYVECGLYTLLNEAVKAGSEKNRLIVKLFGGANMFGDPNTRTMISVGMKNIEKSQILLAELGLKATAQDVGGMQGRKLMFFTDTGEVRLWRLGSEDVTAIV